MIKYRCSTYPILSLVSIWLWRVANLSRTCRNCRRDRVKVYLDNTCETFATIWKLGFNVREISKIGFLYLVCAKNRATASANGCATMFFVLQIYSESIGTQKLFHGLERPRLINSIRDKFVSYSCSQKNQGSKNSEKFLNQLDEFRSLVHFQLNKIVLFPCYVFR